ncbi:MAG: hypothetical protein GXO28_02620 [Methanopyri archaeon]|nr:hypothetical protein [Methanopyri archaeon]
MEGLCPECYLEENPLIEVPEDLEVEVCAQCLAVKTGLGWREPDPELPDVESILIDHALSALEDEMKVLPGARVRLEPLEVKGEPGGPGSRVIVRVLADAEAEIDDVEISKRYLIEIPIRFSLCDRCMKHRGGYFEAILQVRSFRGELTEEELEEVMEFIRDTVPKLMEKDGMAYVSDSKILDEGLDVYMGSLASARKLARLIVQRFGGTVGESHRVVGYDHEKSREKTKASLSVRIPHFSKGDVIEYEGRPHLVLSLGGGGKPTLEDLRTGETVRPDWEELKGVRVLETERGVVIEENPPRVVLPSGRVVECHETDEDVKVGDEVRVVVVGDEAFILPDRG